MITDLSITGLGVIESAEVEFGPRFTVVTGETGAGKTMVLTALEMLMGARPPSGLVRGEVARVEGAVLLTDSDSDAAALASEVGAEVDDGELILARVLPAAGRARAIAGGASVPAAKLGEICAGLVTIHGQSDQVQLRQPARQRALLDAFAGGDLARMHVSYRATFGEFTEVMAELADRVENATQRRLEADTLRDGLQIFDQVAPEPGEDVALRAEEESLADTADILTACQSAHAALSDAESGDDAVSRVAAAVRALDAVGETDGQLRSMAVRLRETSELLAETAAELASYTARIADDPARLDWVQHRRAELAKVTRTFGPSLDDALAWAERSERRLAELEGDDERIEELAQRSDHLVATLADQARDMSMLRAAAAQDLAERVTEELRALAMPDAQVRIDIAQTDDDRGLEIGDRRVAFTGDGVDQVSFMLAPHRGADFAPLGQGASGGELSRVMLALEVALAGIDATPTMVFDEVDAGVGGKAAVEVGRRLARLGKHTQVIVVTHLPQVAAFADTHLVVAKGSAGTITASNVRPVSGEARRRELARMLAGQEESDHALAHADELLEMGRREWL
ncbi:MAG: DNA repair protein RecN [Actinobacteria bacterium]|nr:DNA repair protein RecN [Actinomycetota bacterium]